jgi:hypothetical protein
MNRLILMAALLLVTLAAGAQPLRQHDRWAIHPQTTAEQWQALLTSPNLAEGKPVTYHPEPSYAPPKDDGDPVQLTDGQIVIPRNGQIFPYKLAVGWAYQDFVRVTIDLQQLQPVGQVVVRIQGGINKENTVPRHLALSLSDKGDHFSPVLRLSKKVHGDDNPALTFEPLPDEPMVYAFALQAGYRARYVRLDFATHGHLVMDEIAVLAATGPVAELPPPPAVSPDYRDNVFDRREQYQKLIAPGNLVAGKTLRYSPQPGYRLTTGDSDPQDLTDGQFGQRTDEKIWFEQGAVTWQHSPQVTIFMDLGEVQPVSAVVGRFLGGAEQGGLTFPDELRVLASADGEDYYQVTARHKRGLDDLSDDAYDLPEEGVAWVHNFVLPVGLKVRYLALQAAHQKQFISSDEVAVVRGGNDLVAFRPDPARRVVIVTSGVAFGPVQQNLPVATMPLRTKLAIADARPTKEYQGPCKLVIDLPDTIKMWTTGFPEEKVTHDGRTFTRYVIPANRGKLGDFYLQSLLPGGKSDVLYCYGDAGQGLENERKVTWESLDIPKARLPKRLHVSLAWSYAEGLINSWPNYFAANKHLGFNCVAFFPRYWKAEVVPVNQAVVEAARKEGFQIIANESPAGALSGDRKYEETKSQLDKGPSSHVCPSYRGQYYQKEHQSFADHAVWIKPDYFFYDIEAYWHGSQEAPRCSRCKERFQAGNYKTWDEFRGAMGIEIHRDMKARIDEALKAANITQKIIYGSYRTQPIGPLNDGLFNFDQLYPEYLQLAMPSLYVAGNQMSVANNISRNRAQMTTNDIIPWLSTGTYGEYEPSRSRDLILEALANGARGVTYYYYANFDPAHFMYHAQAVDLAAPIEDLFVDGQPLTGLQVDNPKLKVCGMGVGAEKAVLISNYAGVAAGTTVKVTVPVQATTAVYDMDSGRQIGQIKPGQPLELKLDTRSTVLLYVGSKYARAVAR